MAVSLFNAVRLIFVAGHTMCRVCLSRLTSSQQILHRHMCHLFLLFFGGGQFEELVFLLMPSKYIVVTTSVSPSLYFLDLKSTCPCLILLAALPAVFSALCSHVVGVLNEPQTQLVISGFL